jgi:hypothetical protein
VRLSSDDVDRLQALVENWPKALANSIVPELDLESLVSRTALGLKLFRKRFSLFELATREVQAIVHGPSSSDKSQSEARGSYSLNKHSHVNELAKLTGHPPKFVRSQIESGNISPAILKHGDLVDPQSIEIDAHSLTLATSFYANSLDLHSSAARVGCSVQALRGLVQTACIPAGSIWIDPRRLAFRRVHPAALEDFVSELISLARCEVAQVTGGIKFSDWVTKHARGSVNRHLRWRDILSSVRTGKLTLYRAVEVPTELDQLFLCAEDLAIVCDKRRSSHKCFL